MEVPPGNWQGRKEIGRRYCRANPSRRGRNEPAMSHLARSDLNCSFKMKLGVCLHRVPKWNIIQQTHYYVANLQPSINEWKYQHKSHRSKMELKHTVWTSCPFIRKIELLNTEHQRKVLDSTTPTAANNNNNNKFLLKAIHMPNSDVIDFSV